MLLACPGRVCIHESTAGVDLRSSNVHFASSILRIPPCPKDPVCVKFGSGFELGLVRDCEFPRMFGPPFVGHTRKDDAAKLQT